MTSTSSLVRSYAEAVIADYDDAADTPALFHAVLDAITEGETVALGRAILSRHHALCDAPIRTATMHCPKCDKAMEHIDSEPDVGIVGGWECSACDTFVPEWDTDDEP